MISNKLKVTFFLFLTTIMGVKGQKVFVVEPQHPPSEFQPQNAPKNSIMEAIKLANDYWAERNEDVVIHIKSGKYYINEPIVLSKHTLSNKKDNVNLTIIGDKQNPPIISGGKKITNWKYEGNNIYSASINQNSTFRQLYIDGKRAVRAREPNICNNYYRLNWNIDHQVIYAPTELQNFDLSDGGTEIFIQKIWSCQIYRISHLNEFQNYSEINLLPQDEIVFNTRKYQIKDGLSFHLENNPQFLDANNEWYLDNETDQVFLYKTDFNDISINVEAPKLDKLMIIRGDKDREIKNVTIQNLIFENTNWVLPDSSGLYAGQATYIYEYKDKQPKNGTVIIENAKNIEFSNNIVRNTGGNALMLYHNVSHASINNNIIYNISSNGIVVDWKLNKNLEKKLYCNKIDIRNNLITRVGQDYFGSVGIVTGFAYDINIAGNFLYNLPYTGISVGWGHTYDRTSIKNNIVSYNYVGNVMKQMSDGGGIYTLSNQPGTIVESNFIEDIVQSKWSFGKDHVYGIYLDEGSSNIIVRNNIFSNVTKHFTTNKSGFNHINLNNPLNIREFEKNNILYRNRDSLRTIYAGDFNCLDVYSNDKQPIVVPNPINKEFYLITNSQDNSIKVIEYELYTLSGHVIYKGAALYLNNDIYYSKIPSRVKSGVYVLNLHIQGSVFKKQIVINTSG